VKRFLSIFGLIALYLVLFLCISVVHFRLVPVTVVLYAALFDAVLAAATMAAIAVGLLRRRLPTTSAEIALALCVGVLLAVIYSIMVPTLIDRSLSIYVLEKLHQHRGGIKQGTIEDVITQTYFIERRVVDVRLTEQLDSGTITIKDGCIRLTPRGEFVVRLSQFYRKTMLPKRRKMIGTIMSDFALPSHDAAPAISPACN
jgi:hypothetical protein